jgi:isopenicillin-N N-acyltransferase like protein
MQVGMIQGLPHIRVSGSPSDRGRQLGEVASERVGRSIANYVETFSHYTGLDWSEICDRAEAFLPSLEAYDAELIEELHGVADGAGVEFRDLLAINVRTEVMYGIGATIAAECTSFGIDANTSANHHVLVGQNWDWRSVTRDALIVLEVEQPGKPSFVTIVEAGLFAKMGFNSAGIALATNLLVTDLDRGEPAVPFHAILRGILDSWSLEEAVDAITRAPRSSSANYLIGDVNGDLRNLEATPGGPEGVYALSAERGMLTHANCFVAELPQLVDVGLEKLPDSPARTARLRSVLAGEGRLTLETLKNGLTDHEGHPASVCRHPNQEEHPIERIGTNVSVIIDLTARQLHIAVGPPCQADYDVITPFFGARAGPGVELRV